jgi:hypothetical protein
MFIKMATVQQGRLQRELLGQSMLTKMYELRFVMKSKMRNALFKWGLPEHGSEN